MPKVRSEKFSEITENRKGIFLSAGRIFSITAFILVQIKINEKQLENVKCFKYLGSLLMDDGSCTCEIKSRIAMAKAAFNKKQNLFTSKLDLNLRKKLVKCYIWSMALYGDKT
jgi:hypothetical protein